MAHLPGPPEGCSETRVEAVFGVRRPRVPGLLGAGLGLRVQEMGARRPAPWASLGRGMSEKGLRFCRGAGLGPGEGHSPQQGVQTPALLELRAQEGKRGAGETAEGRGGSLGGGGHFKREVWGRLRPAGHWGVTTCRL